MRYPALALVLLYSTTALSLTTKVIPKTDLNKRSPMVSIAPQWSVDASVKTPDFIVNFSNDRMVVRGHDKANRPWRALLSPAGRGIWRTDNIGIRTYYFVGYTGAAGIGPPTWILALTFDAQGRPNPFYVAGYATYDAKGIQDLVDLDGSGPQLIQQDWCGTDWDHSTNPSQSGFWVTTLYEQRGGYWNRVDGRHGIRTFPLLEKWSRWSPTPPALVPTESAAGQCSADHGNEPTALDPATISQVNNYSVRANAEPDCGQFLPDVAVRDTAAGREIEVQDQKVGRLLETIVRNRDSVVLSGFSGLPKRNYCRVSVLWAEPPTPSHDVLRR